MRRIYIVVFFVLLSTSLITADESQTSGEIVISASDPILKQLLHANRELTKRLQEQHETIESIRKETEEAKQQFQELLKQLDEKREALKSELENRINESSKQNDELNNELKSLRDKHEREVHNMQSIIDRLKEILANDFDTVTFDGIEFVKIPAGTFVMGTDESTQKQLQDIGWWKNLYNCEMPSREIEITNPFFISKYEITQGQWKQVIERDPSVFNGDNRPVENVNWFDTFRFTNAISDKWGVKYRLPTEAEWEYCARAGSSLVFGLGKDKKPITNETIGEYAWINSNSENKTQPVGKKLPNAWGLYDMHGNVWEWCNDHFSCDAYETLKQKNPRFRGDVTEAVFRGGCWDLEAQFSRVAFRGGNLKSHNVSYVGFRVVREMSQ